MSHHDHSSLKNLENASVNRSGRPVRAASVGVAQYLVAAKEAASSRACCNYEANPRYCTFANSWSTPCREHSTCIYFCNVLLLRLERCR